MAEEFDRVRVIRPGPLGYVYALAFPAVAVIFGLAIIFDSSATHGKDLAVRLPAGLFVVLAGAFPAAHFLGIRIEVDPNQVSKVYLFGLVRESIPIAQLAGNVEYRFAARSGSYPYARFMNADGRGAFNLYPRQVWRSSDVDELLRLAKRPWDFGASPKRQHGAVLAFMVLLAIVVFVSLFVWFAKGQQTAAVR
ncbi:MAG: hypothetical protein E6J40_13770 [Chloroflexi bacterium]|nr:MAG: hypothetical protein E6J40_13770 [Chloroflexota bacterium]